MNAHLSVGDICLNYWPEPSFVYVSSKDSCEAVRMLAHARLKLRWSPMSMVPISRSQKDHHAMAHTCKLLYGLCVCTGR